MSQNQPQSPPQEVPPPQPDIDVPAPQPAEMPPPDPKQPPEIGGARGPEPTRYGDWQHRGRCTDF